MIQLKTQTVRERVVLLRLQGKTYKEISVETNLSKATISWHCKRAGIGGDPRTISEERIESIKIFRKTNSRIATAQKFDISVSSVTRYIKGEYKTLTPEDRKTNNYIRIRSFRQRTKIKGIEYLGGKCIKCGYNKCPGALHFHHRNPTEKEFTISGYQQLAWVTVREELDKCDLLCANCHAEAHSCPISIV